MAESGLRFVLEFRDNSLSQHFTQLNAPLVEGVDIPNCSLSENVVLVERNEFTEGFRREALGKDRVRRPVALEDACGYKPIRRALRLDFRRRLAEGQRLGLGEDVRHEHVVVPAERVERLAEPDEITRDEPGSLVDQLVEGVLAIGSRLAPIDGTGIIGDFRAIKGYMFAIALHRQLLQIGREALEIL